MDARNKGASEDFVNNGVALARRGTSASDERTSLHAKELPAANTPSAADTAAERAAVKSLRAWRLVVSRATNTKAFHILHDTTLNLLAAARPTTLDGLRAIPRVTQRVVDAHGEGILAALAAARDAPEEERDEAAPPRKKARQAPLEPLPAEALPLAAALRVWRTEMAKAECKAPYLFLTDKTLGDVAVLRPKDTLDLRGIKGFGDLKVAAYGEAVLVIVAAASGGASGGAGAEEAGGNDSDAEDWQPKAKQQGGKKRKA